MHKKLLILSPIIVLVGILQLNSTIYARGNEKATEAKQKPLKLTLSSSPSPSPSPSLSPSSSPSPSPSIKPSPSTSPSPDADRARVRRKPGARFTLDEATGKVVLTTPSGNVHVLKLSAAAINNMFGNGLLDKEPATDEATDSAKPATESGEVSETEEVINEEVTETRKVLGLIPVKIKINIKINTTTGDAVVETQSVLAKIFGFLLTE